MDRQFPRDVGSIATDLERLIAESRRLIDERRELLVRVYQHLQDMEMLSAEFKARHPEVTGYTEKAIGSNQVFSSDEEPRG